MGVRIKVKHKYTAAENPQYEVTAAAIPKGEVKQTLAVLPDRLVAGVIFLF